MITPRFVALGLLVTAGLTIPLSATIDQNGDGISDVWSGLHPGIGAPGADPDGDGASNLAEARAGTDPSSATNHLAATPVRKASGDLVLSWTGVPGKRYHVESSSDLSTWTTLPTEYAGSGAVLEPIVQAAGTATGTRQFWRVVVADTDTDSDGLNDWEEAQLGTSAANPDTDGDGQSDGAEVLAGTDPLQAPIVGNTYYLDANSGNDLGDGSQAHPWKTFKKALASVQAHDLVLMNSGNYGTLVAGRTKDVNQNWGDFALPLSHFADWVTFRAAPGQDPHATKIDFGTLNTTALTANNLSVGMDFSVKGNADVYVRLDGLTIDDGVRILGSRHVEIVNCKIHRLGDLSGSVTNIDTKAGVEVLNGRYVTIRGNDITHVSVGIGAATYDFAVVENDIHHNSHDGLRVWGGDTWLIEGNRIHDLDDGIEDGEADWNRHTDGMQIWTLLDVTNNVTVRRNLFYHLESLGIMWNDSTIAGRIYTNWTFENNVFGPVGGLLFHGGTTVAGKFEFRNNTIVYAPNDAWVSIYPNNLVTAASRALQGTNYHLGWPGCTGDYRVYNNIFADGSEADVYPTAASFSGSNFYRQAPDSGNAPGRGDKTSTTLPYETIPGNINDYIATTGHLPGTLTAGSVAIDAGTRFGDDSVTLLPGQLEDDFNGLPRDNRPDLGALEVPGRSPPVEEFGFLADPAVPLHFVDNFDDGRLYLRDPFLNGADTMGLVWVMPAGSANFRTINQRGEYMLSTVFDFSPALVTTTKVFRDVTLAFDFNATWPDCGVVVLYQNGANFTYFDFAGRLVRRTAGVDTVIATVPAIADTGRGALTIATSGTTVTLTMKLGATTLWTKAFTAPYQTGAVGFYRFRTTGKGWDRVDYDNVQIDLATAADLIGDLQP